MWRKHKDVLISKDVIDGFVSELDAMKARLLAATTA